MISSTYIDIKRLARCRIRMKIGYESHVKIMLGDKHVYDHIH